MPYINTTTTVKISENQEAALKEAMGKAISLIPGKSESWLMLNFRDCARMAFRGDANGECAMLEVEILGKADAAALDKLTAELCRIVSEVLSVPSDRIYVKYNEIDVWGYDGANF